MGKGIKDKIKRPKPKHLIKKKEISSF